MEKKENVYEKTEGTGEGIEMENGAKEDCRTSAPTVPTKFKDVDALVRAYEALQSEFTRRSQRLKELERKAENLESEKQNARHFGSVFLERVFCCECRQRHSARLSLRYTA